MPICEAAVLSSYFYGAPHLFVFSLIYVAIPRCLSSLWCINASFSLLSKAFLTLLTHSSWENFFSFFSFFNLGALNILYPLHQNNTTYSVSKWHLRWWACALESSEVSLVLHLTPHSTSEIWRTNSNGALWFLPLWCCKPLRPLRGWLYFHLSLRRILFDMNCNTRRTFWYEEGENEACLFYRRRRTWWWV